MPLDIKNFVRFGKMGLIFELKSQTNTHLPSVLFQKLHPQKQMLIVKAITLTTLSCDWLREFNPGRAPTHSRAHTLRNTFSVTPYGPNVESLLKRGDSSRT